MMRIVMCYCDATDGVEIPTHAKTDVILGKRCLTLLVRQNGCSHTYTCGSEHYWYRCTHTGMQHVVMFLYKECCIIASLPDYSHLQSLITC